jgi:hypothetical protein
MAGFKLVITPEGETSLGRLLNMDPSIENTSPPVLNFMRAIWKGYISFGLVSIPISLFPATQREELKFRMLRRSDLSPINYKRVAEADGKEVPWDQVVKGYEYQKNEFIVVTDEDFERADVKATQTVDILNFVKLDEINPILFYKPYYVQAEKGGEKAYGNRWTANFFIPGPLCHRAPIACPCCQHHPPNIRVAGKTPWHQGWRSESAD